MDNKLKKFFSKCVWLTIIIFVIRCLISKYSLINNFSLYDLCGYAGEAISISTFIMLLYEKYFWKSKYNVFNEMPVLHKQYKGVLHSNYDNKARNATLTVKQTLLTLSFTLNTEESRSSSFSSSIEQQNGEWKIIYSYINNPNSMVRDRSEIHYGTTILYIDGDKLNGRYYTDRMTRGDISFEPVK